MYGRTLKLAGALVALLFAPVMAHATLIGDEITAEFILDGVSQGTATVEVTAGVEFVGPGFGLDDGESVDIGAASIIAVVVDPFLTPDTSYLFTDLDWVDAPGRIVGFTLTTDIEGLTAADVTFGDDFVMVNSGDFTGTGTLTIDLDVTHSTETPVAEPHILSLLAAGMLGIALLLRRRAG